MKKSFVLALSLLAVSGSTLATGPWDHVLRMVDRVAIVADTLLDLKNAPVVKNVVHPKPTKAEWTKDHSRWPRAALSLLVSWAAWKSKPVQVAKETVVTPVKRALAKRVAKKACGA